MAPLTTTISTSLIRRGECCALDAVELEKIGSAAWVELSMSKVEGMAAAAKEATRDALRGRRAPHWCRWCACLDGVSMQARTAAAVVLHMARRLQMRVQDVSVLWATPESSGRAAGVARSRAPGSRAVRRAPRWWREPVQLEAPGSRAGA